MSRARVSLRQRNVATVVFGVVLAAGGVVGGAVQVLRTAAAEPASVTPARSETASVASPLVTEAVPAAAVDPAVVVRRPRVGEPSDLPGSLGSAPPAALTAYQRAATIMGAASGCGLEWTLLTAVGRAESNHGRDGAVGAPLDGTGGSGELPDTDLGVLDTDPRWDAPVGPMRLLPATWAEVAVDADDNGVRDPQDLDDAALAAAVLLCSHGDLSEPDVLRSALASYHRAPGFVRTVLVLATRYARQSRALPAPPTLELPLPSLPDLCACLTRPAAGAAPTASPSTASPSAAALAATGTGGAHVGPTPSPSTPFEPPTSATPTETVSPTGTASPTDLPSSTDPVSPIGTTGASPAPQATP